MGKRICVFPFDEEFIPFLNIIENNFHDDDIDYYTVKGSYYYNKLFPLSDDKKIRINDIEKCFETDFDILLIIGSNTNIDFETEFLPVIKKANTLKKEIRVKRIFSEKEMELCEKSNIKMSSSSKKEIVIDEEMTERILPLRTPIVFVLGIFEYTDKLYTELYLHQYLKGQGIKTKSILTRINEIDMEDCYSFPEFMYNNKYSDRKKVIMFNHYVRKIELQSNPDIILIGIPGEIMPLDEKNFGHFGIMPYLISNAVKCDYAVLQVFHNLCDQIYVNELKEICKTKFSIEVDACCISHSILDFSSLRDDKMRFYYSNDRPKDADTEYYYDFINGNNNELGKEVIDTLIKYGNYRLL